MKAFKFIVVLFILTTLSYGSSISNKNINKCFKNNIKAPLWVCEDFKNIKGKENYASSSFKINQLGVEFARKQALAKARAKLNIKNEETTQIAYWKNKKTDEIYVLILKK